MSRCYYGNYLKLDTDPFDDNKAFYDEEEHYYIPKLDYIQKKTGIDLELEFKDRKTAEIEVRKITDAYMDIIYSSANQAYYEEYRRIKEYKAAKDHNIRTPLINGMVVYIEACVETSIDKIGNEHGVNLESTARVDIKDYDDLSTQAKRKIIQTGLFYFGTYNYFIDPNDYRQGY